MSPLAAIGNTPLIELQGFGPDNGGRNLAKWEGANPTGSMKDRMARAMIEGARRDGELREGQRVVEYTGGSTGSSLAFVCAFLQHPLSLITADCFAKEKIRMMQALGAEVDVLKTPEGKVHPGLGDQFEQRLHEVMEATGAYWTRQLSNARQLEGYAAMGREILAACPAITDFVMSAGTAGCSMGNARAFRETGADVRVTLVEPEAAPHLSKGQRGRHGVEGIAVFERDRMPLLDSELYAAVLSVPEQEGREMARRLARAAGLLVGTSSGLNLAAAVRVAAERGPDATVVTVLVDTGLKYLTGSLYGC
ncbi:MAG: cysteine synthase family protein [Candidatus Krumholzibacteria bacterium]|nr:cysteine synthase family protein [Candidatus Krumholzibacteria bacterium]